MAAAYSHVMCLQGVPTPFVASGVHVLQAAAGIMVTASHNPKEYNGYKVYWGNGCQVRLGPSEKVWGHVFSMCPSCFRDF
jgi:phosphomannomutase